MCLTTISNCFCVQSIVQCISDCSSLGACYFSCLKVALNVFKKKNFKHERCINYLELVSQSMYDSYTFDNHRIRGLLSLDPAKDKSLIPPQSNGCRVYF